MKIDIGTRIGHWTIVAIQERLAICECRCKNIRAIFLAALVDGSAASSCGCSPRTAAERILLKREADARATVAE
jgi:hypothetical protein